MGDLKTLIQHLDMHSSGFIDRVVSAMREYLGSDISFLAEFSGDRKVFRKVAGDGAAVGLGEGVTYPLKETYCYRMSLGKLPNIVLDTHKDDRVKDLPITHKLKIRTYVSVPVRLSGNRLFGSLCGLFHNVDLTVQERDIQFMQVLAEILGEYLSKQEQETRELSLRRERIEKVIRDQAFHMVFQPIVDIRTGEITGAEALARFEPEPYRTPDLWFAEAWEVGLGCELEIMAMRRALAHLTEVPDGAFLGINVSPETVQTEAFLDALADVEPSRLMLELTEHVAVEEYPPLLESVAQLRARGIHLAIDDVGSGYSGLGHILQINPDIMKLDRFLTQDIYRDAVKQALATSTVNFSARVGTTIIAEGIETTEDALALHLLGIRHGQGYHFAKPGPLPLESTPGLFA